MAPVNSGDSSICQVDAVSMAPRFVFFLFLLLPMLLFPGLAAFLLAASPVLLLAAFLLALVLVYSEPNVPEAEDHPIGSRTKIKPIYPHASYTTSRSSDDDVQESDSESDASCSADEEPVSEKAAVWTAEDEKSILNIGSLELERNAAVEKLMSSRSMHRYHADRDLIDLDGDGDGHLPPGSAPSMHRNPFFFDDDQQEKEGATAAMVFSRHESFAVVGFRPYFVADKTQQPVAVSIPIPVISESSGGGGSSSSSSSSATVDCGGQHMDQEAAATTADSSSSRVMGPTTADSSSSPRAMVTVDVELISDSSDDDEDEMLSLPGQQRKVASIGMSDDDDGESFEVESITRQVNETLHAHAAAAAAAAREGQEEDEKNSSSSSWASKLASVPEDEKNERREREVLEIRERDIFLASVPEASAAPANSVNINAASSAGGSPPLDTTAAPKAAATKSSRYSYKPPSRKAVLGLFRK
ncbi:uncharacterized protein LOC102719479 [Oryza brachyantha]|uniref:Uncharacterized protein n=1 Tax=Oryza brachyantha TaxID=4533 RepID=J3LV22_ORYBR|nr:uncharacterized protein LOC102719479 [Oryza brachyantha]